MLKVIKSVTLFGATLFHITLGSSNAFGNFNTYFTSYLRKFGSPNLSYAESSWITAVMIVSFTISTIISGYLTNKIGTRFTCLIGSVIFSGSTALSYYAITYSFSAVILSFAAFQSIGSGFIYTTVIVNCIKWFPDSSGFISGLITACNCIAGVIFSEFQTFYLNPQNLKPNSDGYFEEDEILSRVPQSFIVMSIIFAVIQIIAIFLTFDSESFEREHVILIDSDDSESECQRIIDNCESSDSSSENCSTMTIDIIRDYKLSDAMKTLEFYVLWVTFGLGTQSGYFMGAMNKAFGETFIDDDHYLTVILSMAWVSNAIGGVSWGLIMDKLGFKGSIACINGILSTTLFSIIFSVYFLPKILFALFNITFFFTSVGIWTCYIPEVSRKFGSTNAIKIYGMVHTSSAIFSVIFAPVFQIVMRSFGWFVTFCMTGILSTISMAIIMVLYRG